MTKARYTADMILIKKINNIDNVVLIERKNYPFGYAIAGGFRDVLKEHLNHKDVVSNKLPIPPELTDDSILENAKDAAVREIIEETGCLPYDVKFLCRKDGIKRDPRGYAISDVFYGYTNDDPVAADDAKSIVMVPIDDLKSFLFLNKMAFDHDEILMDFLKEKGAL